MFVFPTTGGREHEFGSSDHNVIDKDEQEKTEKENKTLNKLGMERGNYGNSSVEIADESDQVMKFRVNMTHNLNKSRAALAKNLEVGIYKSKHEDMRSLWATKGRGRRIFLATMNLARFSFLLGCLQFNDPDTRIERAKTNKLAAISEIFQKFVENCKACYCSGAYVTVDEMLIPFRGYAKTHYMCMAEIYAGSEVGNKYKETFKLTNPTGVVLRLAAPIFGTNRNVSTDKQYSSMELVEELRKHNITYVETLGEK
ncbi:hypothetical protein ILUMI_00902 [Ignelater luminosus]|uniref:PiggyBac transposable element-derived protein domain-containing protein n=1 Tax=Ignelater luminosus TaxID=2038154 RepID=A0A8K0DKR1_IGNLU|nr:hypothetical protein ILUMI_00902 [Ignelater luminosus]